MPAPIDPFYFVVENHAFVDGNKRIGAFLFIWFLDANGLLYRKDGTKRLADNALVALTLLIAESKPAEKDTLCKVVVNLINRLTRSMEVLFLVLTTVLKGVWS